VIGTWAAANGLSIDPFEPVREPVAATRPPAPGRGGRDVRTVLRRAIDRMPESELMRISIPVEYLLED
jgi:hypothetical protein